MNLPDWWGSDKPYQICDCLEGLRSLPDEVVQCVVTSPPYWGLRDYGTATWEGGDADCDHIERKPSSTYKTTDDKREDIASKQFGGQYKYICKKCGAKRIDQQIGLEESPEAYLSKMVEIFREVRRVLRSDGTCWVNMGDCYWGSGSPGGDFSKGKSKEGADSYLRPYNRSGDYLKPKDLVGMPWRLAFALQADGWYLRSDIIWAKPNPMPESVTDRPTKSHEYIFLLTKSSRNFYDADAIREPVIDRGQGRNKRDVWTITTKPYSEAHFATFPPELPETCIKAGTSQKGCCGVCGAPWERVIEREKAERIERDDNVNVKGLMRCPSQIDKTKTLGWQPTCSCNTDKVLPCIVLDPFLGSGTTAEVARLNGRIGLGFELNPDYEPLIIDRSMAEIPALERWF